MKELSKSESKVIIKKLFERVRAEIDDKKIDLFLESKPVKFLIFDYDPNRLPILFNEPEFIDNKFDVISDITELSNGNQHEKEKLLDSFSKSLPQDEKIFVTGNFYPYLDYSHKVLEIVPSEFFNIYRQNNGSDFYIFNKDLDWLLASFHHGVVLLAMSKRVSERIK